MDPQPELSALSVAPVARTAGTPSAGWLAGVKAAIARSEYQLVQAGTDALRFSNRAQGLTLQIRDGAVTVGPALTGGAGAAPLGDWSLSLRARALGRGDSLVALADGVAGPGGCDADGRTDAAGACLQTAEIDRGLVREWWRNTEQGLEQGFTLDTLPAGAGPLRLDVALDGAHVDVGADRVTLTLGATRLTYGGLVTTDATGRRLPSRFVAVDGGVRIEVDDAGAVAPIVIDPLVQTYAWHVEGSQNVAKLGFAVSSAGDVNGDGFGDVIVGAYSYDDGQTDEGAAFAFYGSATGLSETASWTAGGDQVSALFGKAVGSGDFNGDGYSDVVVGAPQYTQTLNSEGAVFVFLGSAGGLSTTRTTSLYGGTASLKFGEVVNGGGDVDGDGDAELLVGAPSSGEYTVNAGAAWLYPGSSTGPSAFTWKKLGTELGANLGGALASAGDVNGDGYGDVIVTASFTDVTAVNEGVAQVYLGGASGLGTTASWTAALGQPNSLFGSTAAGLGDVNGDGYGDVVVGASYYDAPLQDEGAVFVFLGQAGAVGLEATPSWNAYGGQTYGQLGQAVGAAGDVNGDGYADLIVGEGLYAADSVNLESGRAAVFLGSADGIVGNPALDVVWPNGYTRYGGAVAGVGDVNGDGFSDVMVGAPNYSRGDSAEGSVFLYYGAAAGPSASSIFTVSGAGDELGLSVASAGDVNADGFDDLLVGAPGFSNGQADEGGVWLYRGAAGAPSTTASWAVEGAAAGAQLGRSVAGAGDVNGDGYDDVVVGAPGAVGGGASFLFTGGLSASLTASTALPGPGASARFGASVAGAGDVDNDGFADVVIGAPGVAPAGRAQVFRGSAGGLGVTPVATFAGPGSGSSCGASVAGAGDVNGDRFTDVVVGCPDGGGGAGAAGPSVFLLPGSASGTSSTSTWSAHGLAGDQLGGSVAGAGDVNGDGYADVLVGASQVVGSVASGAGYALLYTGGVDGLDSSAALTVEGVALADALGASVSSAGDVNGDGYGDFVLGAPGASSGAGQAVLYLGDSSGGQEAWIADGAAGDALGQSVCAGDFTGDGYSDVVTGTPGTGGLLIFAGNGADTNTSGYPMPTSARLPSGVRVATGDLLPGRDFDVAAVLRSPAGNTRLGYDLEVASGGADFDGAGLISAARPYGQSGLAGLSLTGQVRTFAADAAVRWRMRARVDATSAFPALTGRWTYGGELGERELAAMYTSCADLDGDGTCGRLDADEDADGVTDARDPSPQDPFTCGDADADSCDDCSRGVDGFGPLSDVALDDDGADLDADGLCDLGDDDVDGDGRDDVVDTAPLVNTRCGDLDGDTCEDCLSGRADLFADGPDQDADGVCDVTDPDRDGDGVPNGLDTFPTDPTRCEDTDGDSCDDCASGSANVLADGLDTNADGQCNLTDPDDDGDGFLDVNDGEPLIAGLCGDTDADLCDDCTSGLPNTGNDGVDLDFDGLCDVGDDDIDGDEVLNGDDSHPRDDRRCSDVDEDTCDDCTYRHFDPADDGDDGDSDGICNDGDFDADNDGVDDVDDTFPPDPFRCGDFDADGCEDCLSGHVDPDNDGPDFNENGICDDRDDDDDGDRVLDNADTEPLNPFVCRDADADQCNDCVSGYSDPMDDGADYDGDGVCDVSDPPPVVIDTGDTGDTDASDTDDTDAGDTDDTDTVPADTDDTDTVPADTDDTDTVPADTDDTDLLPVDTDADDSDVVVDTDDETPGKCGGCATGGDPTVIGALGALWLLRRRRRQA